MKHASRTGILTVFLLSFVAMVACLASPSVWIAWSAELGPSTGTPTAEEKIESQGVDPQCIAELEKLCGEIEPGGGRIRKCFDDNIGEFSPVCQRQIMEGKAESAAAILESRRQKELKKAKGAKEATDHGPIALTKQAIVDLADPPGLGGRTTVDLTKRWGSDLSQTNKAVALLQDARSQAGGASPPAIRLLEEAIDYGKAHLHKEARVSAQGALFHLCKADSSVEGCDKVPKVGAYVAP